jgi:uncharacterized protein YjbI with pentapeptide repeats
MSASKKYIDQRDTRELELANDLAGVNLAGRDLKRLDFSNKNLTGANLAGTNLYGTNLYGATLVQANLSGADLGYARLGAANLTEADLTGADLSLEVTADRETSFVKAKLDGAKLGEATWISEDTDFAGASGKGLKIGCGGHAAKIAALIKGEEEKMDETYLNTTALRSEIALLQNSVSELRGLVIADEEVRSRTESAIKSLEARVIAVNGNLDAVAYCNGEETTHLKNTVHRLDETLARMEEETKEIMDWVGSQRTKERKKDMTQETRDNTKLEALKSTGEAVKGALIKGATIASAQEVAVGITNQARRALGDHWPPVLDTPAGKHVAPFVVAAAVHLLAEVYGDAMPHSEKVRSACAYAMTAAGSDVAKEVIHLITPFFAGVAALSVEGGAAMSVQAAKVVGSLPEHAPSISSVKAAIGE